MKKYRVRFDSNARGDNPLGHAMFAYDEDLAFNLAEIMARCSRSVIVEEVEEAEEKTNNWTEIKKIGEVK